MSNTEHLSSLRSIRRHLAVAGIAICVLFGGVGGWAAATGLSGAVVASGRVVVDSYVKKVQHPTGGVVGEILVGEGQKVRAGDVLMRLDATQTRANLAIVVKRLDELMVHQSRLDAERDDLDEIAFPGSLLARMDDPNVAQAVHSERRLFDFRKKSRQGKERQLRERIAQYEMEIVGLKAQEEAYSRGLAVIEEELNGLRPLKAKGYVTVQRKNTLEREGATLGGERGEAIAGQAQAAGRIAEARLQILQIDSDLKTEVGHELREIQGQIGEFVERKVAAEDELRRIDIIAPQTGMVHQLAVHTVGGVISPAETIMHIVPDNDRLAVEAHVSPQDIDEIYLEQRAVLRMSAFNQRTTPELNGEVTRIAAELSEDEQTGLTYYDVRISIPAGELTRLNGFALVPGMPVEAFIRTGERTVFSYLVKPLSDQISRAFREQ